MLKKIKSVRPFLFIGLILSVIFCLYSIYYKEKYWGFRFTSEQSTNVWTIEEHISFEPTDNIVKLSLAVPTLDNTFKIMNTDVIAPNYQIKHTDDRLELTAQNVENKMQDIYYRVTIFDKRENGKKIKSDVVPKVENFYWDEDRKLLAKEIINASKNADGDAVQKIINILNQTPPNRAVLSLMPDKKTAREMAQIIRRLLGLEGIASRLAWGIELTEKKKSFDADVMVEAFINKKWVVYDINTADKGVPEDFVIFQRGGQSLVDIEGGNNSITKYSVVKSVANSFDMSPYRAELKNRGIFDFSMYSLPISEQTTLKWLTIFPLSILIVVVLRNIVGVKTMGTFTPMLISLSLVQTGLLYGLFCFTSIIIFGLLLRCLLSKLNLLLVPRISSVVIFVILIIQILTVVGYRLDLKIASSALFFPIIITAWIIERASIIWEEEGFKNACREIINSVVAAVLIYFVISNPTIRHIMFTFNEINIVILFVVMLIGTYTGYRLTELLRFAPMIKRPKKDV